MRGNRGFTLIEVIVVAAIIAILAGILVPMIFNQIDEARTAKAQGDCRSISTAMLMFKRDTGKWPYFFPNDCTQVYLAIESKGGTSPLNTAGDWQLGGAATSAMLGTILNLPAAAVAQACYNNKAGTYLAEDSIDPWGHKYVVNAINFSDNNPVWVISAGPNGALDTGVNSATLNDSDPALGDDIGVRVK